MYILRIIFAIFILLHGLVHLLYAGQSQRLFELQPGMVWPDGSWAFYRLAGVKVTRILACFSCTLCALGFVAGGISIMAGQAWWRPMIAVTAIFSNVVFILFRDGTTKKLPDKGMIGIIISIAILVTVYIF
jgi:hypothetical protein